MSDKNRSAKDMIVTSSQLKGGFIRKGGVNTPPHLKDLMLNLYLPGAIIV